MKFISKRWAALLVLGLILIVLGCETECRRNDRRPPRPPRAKFDRLLKHLAADLELNAEQRKELEALQRGMRERGRELNRRRHDHMEKIIELVRRDEVSLEDALELDREMKRYHDEQKEFLIASFVKIHASLTPEQRKRLADRLEEVHRRKASQMEQRFGERGPPGEGGPRDGPPESGPGEGPPELPTPPGPF